MCMIYNTTSHFKLSVRKTTGERDEPIVYR